MRKSYNFLVGFFLIGMYIFFGSGCHSRVKLNQTTYFNRHEDSVELYKLSDVKLKIQPGDKLGVTVSALDPSSVAAFNNQSSNSIGVTSNVVVTYQVESDGTINYPLIGRINVNGFTRRQLIDTLTARISFYVQSPVVNVQFANARITVVGEVNHPGVQPLSDERVSIVEVLSQAGDLTSFGRRDSILVVREQDGKRQFGYLNLLSDSIFLSPFYYVRQNDMVYVKPNKYKLGNTDQTFIRNLSIVTGVISIFTSLIFVILNITK